MAYSPPTGQSRYYGPEGQYYGPEGQPYPPHQPPYWGHQPPLQRPTNGLAVVALVCGLAQFVIVLTFIPAIVCGPGDIEHAHKPDEFVPLADLARCEDFLDRMAARWAM